jgi:outer membrane protein TolC
MKKIKLVSIFLFLNLDLSAQNITLSLNDFLKLVISNHPVAKQANLFINDAQAEVSIAKGGFDPKVIANFDQKVFKDKEYFNRFDQVVKVPIQFGGMEFKAGYDRNIGETLSDDIRTPNTGTPYAGVSIPLIQGFAIDERRKTLNQAKIFETIAETEKLKTLNKLVFSATKTYWDWVLAYRQLSMQKEFYNQANERYIAIKNRFKIEDLAAVDTLEASINLDERLLQLKISEIDFSNQGMILSSYLWDSNGQILELKKEVIPVEKEVIVFQNDSFNNLLEIAKNRHPEILKLQFKNDQLNIEERFRKEFLKPRLDLSATALLATGTNLTSKYVNPLNNYKLNVDFVLPIFARKERGKLNQIRIKQLQNKLDLDLMKNSIENDVKIAFNEIQNIQNQISIQQNIILNQKSLFEAEKNKFKLGESTIFMINSRESKLLEQSIKLENLKIKFEKAKAILTYSVGKIND